MRKRDPRYIFVTALAVAAFTVIPANNARCDDDYLKKLGRGIANVVTCPYEISNQVTKSYQEDGQWAGFTVGVVKGLVMMPVRAAVGVYEIATFFVPIPKNYKPILVDPEFFADDVPRIPR